MKINKTQLIVIVLVAPAVMIAYVKLTIQFAHFLAHWTPILAGCVFGG